MNSKPKIFCIFTLLCVIFSQFCVILSAENAQNSVFDEANFLSQSELLHLEDKAKEFEERYDISIIIYFVKDRYSEDADVDVLKRTMQRDSMDILRKYASSDDAIIYFMSLDGEYRDYYFNYTGDIVSVFRGDREFDALESRVKKYMTKNDFYSAATEFLCVVDEGMAAFANGESFVSRWEVFLDYLPIIVIVSLIIAIVAVTVMKSAMKGIKFKHDADMYTVKDSFNVRVAADIFLYSRVSRQRKPESSSSHGGGGGGGGHSHGGGGRC